MTDVNSGTETKFNISASTEFVGATQALVSLTPTKNGTAAFLAVADMETIPSATAAEDLLAYREINFSGTSAQIIQFALSISATQNVTTGEVSGGTGAVLQPSTTYKIVMYSSDSSTTLLSFTTFAGTDAGNPILSPRTELFFDMSEHNFRTGTDGKFQVPFVFSWVLSSSPLATINNMNRDGSAAVSGIGTAVSSAITIGSDYPLLTNSFGNSTQGGIFLHTPRSIALRIYQISISEISGDSLDLHYNQGKR
ncbi:hypothetical protein P0082_08580 [Candidatus Haliotispira prima]|uniref:Uncharacterized protein n=1 Tax=Candidatus Haliotispira prima TaxID=3034016 RepID=A0ABY8MEX0_9SPIO|nr:hypothetical protein P0082_08580 [Candidatus Haliotispira prima]